MTMHIYAFGSVCRGEIDKGSDIDLLAIVRGYDERFDPSKFSVYSYERLLQLWQDGNPFAWHLYCESRLLYADDTSDYLRGLGAPAAYLEASSDCKKFHEIFVAAVEALRESERSAVFELSTAFLAIRNIAICFSLSPGRAPVFSRHAALQLGPQSLSVPREVYQVFVDARLLSTRGLGDPPTAERVGVAVAHLQDVSAWMQTLLSYLRS